MKIHYVCDNCNRGTPAKMWIFNCLWCGKEICETCMHGHAACKECAETHTQDEIVQKFNERYE